MINPSEIEKSLYQDQSLYDNLIVGMSSMETVTWATLKMWAKPDSDMRRYFYTWDKLPLVKLCDWRCSAPFTRFVYDPYKGTKIPWDVFKKYAKSLPKEEEE